MRWIGPLALLLGFLTSAPAAAWVPSTTCIDEEPEAPTNIPYCVGNEFPQRTLWASPSATFRITDRAPADIDPDRGPVPSELEDAIIESFESWNQPDCSSWTFIYEGKTDTREFSAVDGENIVVVHSEDEWPYASSAIALTAVSWDPATTNIVSADMELNGDANILAIDGEGSAVEYDIRNTVTHEAGHFLGLAHTPVEGATMVFNAPPGQVEKRTLEEDDIEGLCALYPVEQPEDPDPGGDGCCSTSAGGRSDAPLGLLVLIAAGGLSRRRFLEVA